MAAISLVNDLKALSDYALSFNEDEDHLSISHEVEPSKGILNDLSSSLFLISPFCVMLRLVKIVQCL
jgi:hypothetical protein